MEQRNSLYSNEFCRQLHELQPLEYLSEAMKQCIKRDIVTQLCLIDMQTYIPCNVMTKVDIASMAHSLECRSPFLDYRIVELAAQIPIQYKIRWKQRKILLRKTYKDLLPIDVIGRRDKRGFGGPTHKWYRGTLKSIISDVLLHSQSASHGFFDQNEITKILNEHMSKQFDHSKRIWALFVFEMWMKTWSNC
jgi:asparagine synthase (glutamine-hydrolysing)